MVSALVDDISIFANNVQNILTLFNSVENWALYNQVNVNITKTEYVNNFEIIKKKNKKQQKLEKSQKNQRKITEFFKPINKNSKNENINKSADNISINNIENNSKNNTSINTNIFNTITSERNTKLTNQGINFIFRYLGVFYCIKNRNKPHWDIVI